MTTRSLRRIWAEVPDYAVVPPEEHCQFVLHKGRSAADRRRGGALVIG
jgi:hypothetical protein